MCMDPVIEPLLVSLTGQPGAKETGLFASAICEFLYSFCLWSRKKSICFPTISDRSHRLPARSLRGSTKKNGGSEKIVGENCPAPCLAWAVIRLRARAYLQFTFFTFDRFEALRGQEVVNRSM